jgi:hypothetical protein
VNEPNPIGEWLQVIADKHDATRHKEGVLCRGSVDTIDNVARLRGLATVTHGNAISLEKPIETRPEHANEEQAAKRWRWREDHDRPARRR